MQTTLIKKRDRKGPLDQFLRQRDFIAGNLQDGEYFGMCPILVRVLSESSKVRPQ